MEIELKKVGIQYLEGEAFENIFPSYKELVDSIKMCRKRELKEHYHYNFMYDNVFSIMGKRGTGKTSVIYTLRENLPDLTGVKSDLRMPIITPDVITRNEGIMDWILAIVGEELKEIEYQMGNSIESIYEDRRENDKVKKGRELWKIYEKLLEYNFSDKYSASSATTFYEAVDNSARRTRNSYQLMQEMGRFWNAYVEYIQLDDKSNKKPLIFFFFDDIDLAPEKVEELLTTIRTFLAHPNVVVLITADEEMFLEVVENMLDRKMGRYQKDLREFLHRYDTAQIRDLYIDELMDQKGDALKRANDPLKDIARMYLGKVMPPSTRYYLTMFDQIDKKKSFICNIREEPQTLMFTLGTQVDNFVRQKGNDNFLRYYGNDIDFYLYFIGNTARQIGNAVWIIKSFIDVLAGLDSKTGEQVIIRKTYKGVQRFLHSSIIANHRLAGEVDNIEDFVDSMFRVDYDGYRFFVDYNFLNGYMEKQTEIRQVEGIDHEIGFQFYALAFFTENMVNLVERRCFKNVKRKMRGVSYFVDFIGMCDVNKDLFRRNTSISEFLYHYGELFVNFKKLKTGGNTEEDIAGVYMYTLSKLDNKVGQFDRVISEWYVKEEKWLQEISGMLFLYYENIYHLDGEAIRRSLYRLDIKGRYAYKRAISSYIESVLSSCLIDIDLEEKAGKVVRFLSMGKEMIPKLMQNRSSSGAAVLSTERFKNGSVSDMLRMPKRKGNELASVTEEQFRSWIEGLLYFGIIRKEKDYLELLSNSSSWIRIFSRLQREFEKYDKISQNVVISNKERLRECYDALREYRRYNYAQDLKRTAKGILYSKDSFCSMSSVLPFMKVIEDIYVSAEKGSRYAAETFREDYTVYMDKCKEITNLFDLSIKETDAGYEQECITLSNVNYAIEIYRLTQIFYYSTLIVDDGSADEKKENYYCSLYKYIKNDILIGKNGDEDLREKLLGYIADGKQNYLRRVLSRMDL